MCKNFWDGRENINKRPSVQRRTERVINHVMQKHSIGMGQAIEKIMQEGLWNNCIEELSQMYPDIKSG